MRTVLALSALVASALAAPAPAAGLHPEGLAKRELVVDTVWTTVWVTVTPGQPPPSPIAQPAARPHRAHGGHGHHGPVSATTTATTTSAPAYAPGPGFQPPSSSSTTTTPTTTTPTTTTPVVPTTTTTTPVVVPETPPAPATSSSTTAPAPASSGGAASDGSPVENGVSWLSVANKWRAAYGLGALKWNSVIARHALNTVTIDKGYLTGEESHHGDFGPGGESEVLAGGFQGVYPDLATMQGLTSFELAYLSWLCESPGDAQLKNGKDYCKIVADTVNMQYNHKADGSIDTGHYDILTNPKNDQIGCAYYKHTPTGNDGPYQGVWGCELVDPNSKYHQ